MIMKLRHALVVILLALIVVALSDKAMASPPIVEVVSPGGIKAWLVQDSKLPLVSLRFAFRGGVEHDLVDKQGLAVLAASLLTQGAGPYDDQAFQQRLADRSIDMNVSAGRDMIQGEVKCLSRAQKEAFRLLGLALTKPRFDQAVFERSRQQQMTSIKMQTAQPEWQARYALYQYIFAGHPYRYRSLGTKESLARLTRGDAVAFVRERLAKDNLYVAVVGDITQSELAVALDAVFGALPDHADKSVLAPVELPDVPRSLLIKREGEQTNVFFAGPMMKRSDPDWYAASIVNYILGGGGFISRLMKEVREQEGLTYGIGTDLAPMDSASLLVGSMATDNKKAAQAWALTRKVWQELYDKGVTQQEIEAARDYMVAALPLSLTSTDALSGALLTMQTRELGRDYLDRQAALFKAVTPQDIERVIHTWFDPQKISVSFVGMPEDIHADQSQDMASE